MEKSGFFSVEILENILVMLKKTKRIFKHNQKILGRVFKKLETVEGSFENFWCVFY